MRRRGLHVDLFVPVCVVGIWGCVCIVFVLLGLGRCVAVGFFFDFGGGRGALGGNGIEASRDQFLDGLLERRQKPTLDY
jgi:hypothetical protein